jgi:hypothetical protein
MRLPTILFDWLFFRLRKHIAATKREDPKVPSRSSGSTTGSSLPPRSLILPPYFHTRSESTSRIFMAAGPIIKACLSWPRHSSATPRLEGMTSQWSVPHDETCFLERPSRRELDQLPAAPVFIARLQCDPSHSGPQELPRRFGPSLTTTCPTRNTKCCTNIYIKYIYPQEGHHQHQFDQHHLVTTRVLAKTKHDCVEALHDDTLSKAIHTVRVVSIVSSYHRLHRVTTTTTNQDSTIL